MRLPGRQRRAGKAGLGPGPPALGGGIGQEGLGARLGSFYQLFLSGFSPLSLRMIALYDVTKLSLKIGCLLDKADDFMEPGLQVRRPFQQERVMSSAPSRWVRSLPWLLLIFPTP